MSPCSQSWVSSLVQLSFAGLWSSLSEKNLLMVAKYSLAPTAQSTGLSNGSQDSSKCPSSSPSAPPPAYSDIDTSSWKPSPEASSAGAEPKDEPGPPGYEDVVGKQPQQVQPVQRKKSL